MEGQHQWSQQWYLAEETLHLYWLFMWMRQEEGCTPECAVSSWWTSQVLSSPTLVSPLEEGEGNGPSYAWQQVAAQGFHAPWAHLFAASQEAWWGPGGAELTLSSHVECHDSSTDFSVGLDMTAQPPAAYPETLACMEGCAAHQLLLSTEARRGVSVFRMPLPPLPFLKMIDSEWDAISTPIIKASSDSCSGRVPAAAGLLDFLCGVLSSTWAVAMLR